MFSFNVNLAGIIELLSKNLYSSPNVYLRELLQNSVDAIRARQEIDTHFSPFISLDIFDVEPVIEKDGQMFISDETTSLIITDNGIGLTEQEIHEYLSTIGRSSKSKDESDIHSQLLGQFGIGFLSAFIVSDEIVLYTKSAKEPQKTIEWRGQTDGNYSVKVTNTQMEIGTRIFIKAKVGMEHFLATENVKKLIKSYGDFLNFPISMEYKGQTQQINSVTAPWETENKSKLLDFGFKTFNTQFFDFFKINNEKLGIDAVIYILPYSPTMQEIRQNSKIYLKRMYLSESKAQLFPDWAFFVKGIFNIEKLEPTASREDFIENNHFKELKEFINLKLIEYLKNLSQENPPKFQHLIMLHALSLKALAIKDEEIYKLFIHLFEFETNQGWMTLPQYLEMFENIHYAPTVDEFRQLSSIASAQGIGLINGGYVYDRDLLERYKIKNHSIEAQILDPSIISSYFDDIPAHEVENSSHFLALADEVLEEFKCHSELKSFEPKEVIAVYNISENQLFKRDIDDIRSQSKDNNLSNILGNLFDSGNDPIEDFSVLCFNFSNNLVQRLLRVTDENVLRRTIEIVYAQSLLMARRPMNASELKLLNTGIIDLLNQAIK
jgi:molecular chaperone HtpG